MFRQRRPGSGPGRTGKIEFPVIFKFFPQKFASGGRSSFSRAPMVNFDGFLVILPISLFFSAPYISVNLYLFIHLFPPFSVIFKGFCLFSVYPAGQAPAPGGFGGFYEKKAGFSQKTVYLLID